MIATQLLRERGIGGEGKRKRGLKRERKRAVGYCFQTHSGSREQILFLIFLSLYISMLWKPISENASC
jgi:hypothetical protein